MKMRSRRRKKRFVISQHCTSERSCRLFHQKCIRSLLIRSLSTFCNTSESWTAEPFPATFCLFQKGVRNKKLHKGIPEPLPPVGHSISLGNQKKKIGFFFRNGGEEWWEKGFFCGPLTNSRLSLNSAGVQKKILSIVIILVKRNPPIL